MPIQGTNHAGGPCPTIQCCPMPVSRCSSWEISRGHQSARSDYFRRIGRGPQRSLNTHFGGNPIAAALFSALQIVRIGLVLSNLVLDAERVENTHGIGFHGRCFHARTYSMLNVEGKSSSFGIPIHSGIVSLSKIRKSG